MTQQQRMQLEFGISHNMGYLLSECAQAALDRIDELEKNNMQLPDIEIVSAAVHQAWMEGKLAKGITSRKAEDGEELMVPYDQLSEPQKQQDRGTVQAVYAAIQKAVHKETIDSRARFIAAAEERQQKDLI